MGWRTDSIRPLRDLVVVRMDPPCEKVGSIIIPETVTYQPGAGAGSRFAGKHGGESLGDRFGFVVAAGPGHWLDGPRGKPAVFQPTSVRVGERVCFGMYNGVHLPAPDDDPTGEYWIMTTVPKVGDINPEVWGVIEDEAKAERQAAE